MEMTDLEKMIVEDPNTILTAVNCWWDNGPKEEYDKAIIGDSSGGYTPNQIYEELMKPLKGLDSDVRIESFRAMPNYFRGVLKEILTIYNLEKV